MQNIDAMLIRYAGVKSPDEVEELTGVPAMEVAKRTKAALGKIDILDVAEKRAKLMLRLEAMVAEVEGRITDASDRNLGALINASRGSIQTILKELREIEKASKEDVDTVVNRVSQNMVAIVERSYDRQLGRLSERFPEIPKDDLAREFRETILEISAEYDADR